MKEIFHRISVRKYQKQAVEPEKIEQLLRAAVTVKEKMVQLSEVSPYAGCAAEAPAVIVYVYRRDTKLPDYAQIDMSIAQENMWLEADALGLGGVWLGIAPRKERMKKVEEILEIPESLSAFSVFVFGYPAEERPQQDRFDRSRIHYI